MKNKAIFISFLSPILAFLGLFAGLNCGSESGADLKSIDEIKRDTLKALILRRGGETSNLVSLAHRLKEEIDRYPRSESSLNEAYVAVRDILAEESFGNGEFGNALTYWKEAYSVESDLQDLALLQYKIGRCYKEMGDWDTSSIHLSQGRELLATATLTSSDLELMANLTMTLAFCYGKRGEYYQAYSVCAESVEMLEGRSDTEEWLLKGLQDAMKTFWSNLALEEQERLIP